MTKQSMQSKNKSRRPMDKTEAQEFEQSVLDIARVARVVAGGRRFSFRAAVVLGDKKGRAGVGVGKGSDVSSAISKAARQSKKNMIKAPMTDKGTLPYEVIGKQTSSVVLLGPGVRGRGIIAGGAVRTVCNLAGYKDITAKILSRSTNKSNNALATINALKKVEVKKSDNKPQIANNSIKKVKKSTAKNLKSKT